MCFCQLASPQVNTANVGRQELLVGAAADLAPLEKDLASAFQQASGGRTRFVFAASGVLARQIEAGAPYDVILSANTAYIKDLRHDGRVLPDTVTVYAYGRLGIWSKKGLHWADLTANGVQHVAIANPAHAPYGQAAEQALRQAGLWDRLRPKLVYGENVRQALQFAQTGNADVTITAWSLVKPLGGGELVDDRLHAPIEQGAAVVSASGQPARARQFVTFLNSERGRQVLARFGFTLPKPVAAGPTRQR